jgi:hypothetical protein
MQPGSGGVAMSAGRIVLIVFGAIILLVALALIAAGGTLVWLDKAHSDSEGFITTNTIHLERASYAITTEPAEIDFEIEIEPWWFVDGHDIATIKVQGSSEDSSKQIFIGIADEADVQAYLNSVNYDEISEFRVSPFRVYYTNHPGSSAPAAPTSQTFWIISEYGPGTQTLEWEVETGNWVLVLMNADGSAGVDVSGSVGVDIPWIFWVGVGLIVGGIVLLIIGVGLILLGTRRRRMGGEAGAGTGRPAVSEGQAPYPFTFKGELTEPLSQWLWLVKWLLIIPHLIVLLFLWVAFVVVWIIALIAIMLTAKYPRSLFDFNVGVLRWTWRVGFYSYQALGTDKYPPFTLDAGGYPADLEVAYPDRLIPGLALVKWWLLAIPHYIVIALFFGFRWVWGPGPGLVWLLVFFGAVVLLFTGRYPRGIFDFVMNMDRWIYRVAAYSGLMTDRYPPFRMGD